MLRSDIYKVIEKTNYSARLRCENWVECPFTGQVKCIVRRKTVPWSGAPDVGGEVDVMIVSDDSGASITRFVHSKTRDNPYFELVGCGCAEDVREILRKNMWKNVLLDERRVGFFLSLAVRVLFYMDSMNAVMMHGKRIKLSASKNIWAVRRLQWLERLGR